MTPLRLLVVALVIEFTALACCPKQKPPKPRPPVVVTVTERGCLEDAQIGPPPVLEPAALELQDDGCPPDWLCWNADGGAALERWIAASNKRHLDVEAACRKPEEGTNP